MKARLGRLFGQGAVRRRTARRSYAPAWVALRKTAQVGALLSFVALFLATRWTGSPWQAWSGLFFKLDPLAALASWLHSLGAGVWSGAGKALWLSLVVIGLTLVAGRAWCGWLCPTGTLLEWLSPRPGRSDARQDEDRRFERLRTLKYVLLFILLFAALLGSLTWMIFDPLTLLERTLAHSLLPAMNGLVSGLEFSLYRFFPALGGALSRFDAWVRPVFLPDAPMPRLAPFTFALIFATLAALNWLAPRFWCRYLCPLGGMLALLSKVALLRRVVRRRDAEETPGAAGLAGEARHDCTACKLCSRRCPTGTIDPQRDFASDPAECTLCLDCLDACPRRATAFALRLEVAPRLAYDPGRRAALASLGAAALSTALLGSSGLRLREHPARLRPPGVVEDPAADGGDMPGCVRCGACWQACPTSGLQPALSEGGLEGLWTPVLTPRLGYCDYSCNACGQVCPVGAIPALSLAEKRQQVIGKAYIDTDRCLAWADGIPCIVCEEMCPLPQKAITWEVGVSPLGGEAIQRPVVNRDLCIGCGICEYKCPLPGAAAIRVVAAAV